MRFKWCISHTLSSMTPLLETPSTSTTRLMVGNVGIDKAVGIPLFEYI